jgi:hypothetical protein
MMVLVQLKGYRVLLIFQVCGGFSVCLMASRGGVVAADTAARGL